MFRFRVVALLLCTTGCMQPAAQVDLKGQQNFTRSGAPAGGGFSAPVVRNTASYAAPVTYTNTPQVTQQSAKVDAIGVSDLSAPTPVKAQAHAPVVLEKKTEDAVNPWTRKSRASEAVEGKGESSSIAAPEKQAVKEQAVVEEKIEKAAAPEKTASTGDLIWPVNGKKVISGFGPKGGGKANDGMNIAAAEGEPVWASADGEVLYVGNELKGYGNMILIKHAGGKSTNYAHLSRATVDKYERVKQGDIIGYVGSTGNVKKPQLYFSVHEGKEAVDPRKYLASEVAGL